MRQLKLISWIIFLQIGLSTYAQNPNWTLPPQNFNENQGTITSLPQSPINPNTNMPETNPDYAYIGEPAQNVHASYTDPNGDLILFTVDERVYDKDGWLVGILTRGTHHSTSYTFHKRGFNERLILPMGNDCNKYAIIYPAGKNDGEIGDYIDAQAESTLYMAIYDVNNTPVNKQYIGENGIGGLYGFENGESNPNPIALYTTLIDIPERDYYAHSANFPGIYDGVPSGGLLKRNFQIAATGLIDNCFYYVFVFDGHFLIRYKLTSEGLEFDDYAFNTEVPSHAFPVMRTEMELIELSNGDYRIAIPMYSTGGPFIYMYDINGSTMEVNTTSVQSIDLSNDSNNKSAEMIGLEFDLSGRYLYFTHNTNLDWPNPFDVYDFNNATIVTSSLPTMTNIQDYQLSFIERSGDAMVLASDDKIGMLYNSSNPSPTMTWVDAQHSMNSGYGNYASVTNLQVKDDFKRYMLPEQLDMEYPEINKFSCDCCNNWNPGVYGYRATESATWEPYFNPWYAEDTIYMKENLIIEPGVDITIDGLTFLFDEDSKVIVRKEETNETGAYLRLTNSAVFSADRRCYLDTIYDCTVRDLCDEKRWPGIIVEGNGLTNTQNFNSSTPHGRLTVEANSMIEYAEVGVRAGSSDYTFSGGGMVRMVDARIKDCLIGVQFDPYIRANSFSELYTSSYIKNSHFSTTADWFGLDVPKYFIDINHLSGLSLEGNLFENQIPTSFDIFSRGIGVNMANSRVSSDWYCSGTNNPCPVQDIVRSEYKNLTYGVYGLNSGTETRTYYEYYSVFTANYTGIHLNNFINPEVLDNEFHVLASKGATGLHLANSTGFRVENNSFDTYQGTHVTRNIGIVVDNSGDDENEIYRNFFTNISRGGVTLNVNSEVGKNYQIGLDWICNEFTSPIYQADLYLDGTMSDEQGDCNTYPAGNLFSASAGSHYDLYSTPNSHRAIDYNYHSGSPSSLIPSPISQTAPPAVDYLLQLCPNVTYSSKSSCPVRKSGLPESINPKSETDDFSSYDEINQNIEYMNGNIDEVAQQLDGGNTEIIVSLFESADGFEEVDALNDEIVNQVIELVSSIDGAISSTVIELLLSSNNEQLIAIGNELEESGAGNSSEESLMNYYQDQLNAYWKEVVSVYMADTTGIVTSSQMVELLTTYQPRVEQRFASIICPQENQSWINSTNCAYSNEVDEVVFPSAIESEELPRLIPEFFESDFFHMPGNTNLLNQYYIDNNSIYDPIIPESDLDSSDDTSEAQWIGQSNDLNETTIGGASIMPNPFNEEVVIDFTDLAIESKSVVRLELYDIVGKKVLSTIVPENQVQLRLDGSNLPVGLLTYIILVNDEVVDSGKMIRTE